MKKVISIIVVLFIIFTFTLTASAQAYSTISENNQQVQVLLKVMLNDIGFEPTRPWYIIREFENDYYCYFSIDTVNETAFVYKYYNAGTNYQPNWVLERSDAADFKIPSWFYGDNNTICIGNVHGTQKSTIVNDYITNQLSLCLLIMLVVTVMFHVFRIRRRFN